MSEKLYADRDHLEQDDHFGHYAKHVMAMTAEGLHSKASIAAELAHRDIVIEAQHAEIERMRPVLIEANDYLLSNNKNYIGSGSILHRKMREAVSDPTRRK